MKTTVTSIYRQLGPAFSQPAIPDQVTHPAVLLWNQALAAELGLHLDASQQADVFSGKSLMPGSKPVAMAYSGHQFGQFNPQLGDGRAHLLGELIDQHGQLHELQLKGSGPTPFARQGDGKCGIKPAVREYLMSEAMDALGVPTTRCLSVMLTGEQIARETHTPGAVVARVARSHIRVGTFEYFAARGMHTELTTLADLSLDRHFPQIDKNEPPKYLSLLSHAIDNQIKLIVEWMRVGFIHGVMNTDNTLISGHTIDYGPCAMMGVYDPGTVFSSIDRRGRYAFANQPQIAQWNMARLAECLLPLIDTDEQQALATVTPLIEAMNEQYNQAYNSMLSRKIGFDKVSDQTIQLSVSLLKIMERNQLDYTATYMQLHDALASTTKPAVAALHDWYHDWKIALADENSNSQSTLSLMAKNNPRLIPRNHHMEAVLAHAAENLSGLEIEPFLTALRTPYEQNALTERYQGLDANADLNYQTFCGT